MQDLGYYNGKIGRIDEMTIPMNDRVSWFGDGVYDAGPCRNYHIFLLDEHIDRLFRSASLLDIKIPMSKDELKALLQDLVKKLDSGNQIVYYQVTRGTAMRNHAYGDMTGNLWVTLRPAVETDFDKPRKLITTEDTRYFHCNIKTLNLIPNILAAEKARRAGCDETVFYRPGGRVTECAHSNISIIKNGELYTAPTDNLILPGISRAHLIKACNVVGIPVHEEPFTLEDLFNAEEIAITASSLLAVFANEIDGRPAGGKQPELRKKIQDELKREYYSATD